MQQSESPREPERAGPIVLVVDDEELFARAVGKKLRRSGVECELALDIAGARDRLARQRPDLMLLDVRLPDGSGLDFLRELRAGAHADLPVLVLTAFGGLQDAVAAMKERADDYLTKPIDLDELMVKIERVLGQAEVSRRLEYSRQREQRSAHDVPLVGTSAAMNALSTRIARIQQLASHAVGVPPTVLIQGETGTGKDLAARALHRGSDRAGRPFVHVDCAALPKDLIEAELFGHEKGAFTHAHAARTGLIEAAENGTVYLDEIGELPLDLQSRLLAVLERREVRRIGSTRPRPVAAWFIAATNRDLDEMVSRGDFRPDLYFRLKVLSLDIPPLRERLDDVDPLFEHFAVLTARRYGMPAPTLSPELLDAARRHDWPGNVREARAHGRTRDSSRRRPAPRCALARSRARAGRSARQAGRRSGRPDPRRSGAPAHCASVARDRRQRVRVGPTAWRVPNGASLPNSEVRTRARGGRKPTVRRSPNMFGRRLGRSRNDGRCEDSALPSLGRRGRRTPESCVVVRGRPAA